MAANFNTLQNKEFLWKLMYETKLFEGLDNSMVGTIQKHFENKMAALDMKKTKEDTLITLNKQIIQKMVKDIGKNNINQNNTETSKAFAIPTTKQMITAQDITQNRKEIFDIQLKTIQTDFDQMINAAKPNIIEFEDKNLEMNESFDDNSTIEKLLAETIAKRKDMLININSADINKAAKWLNREEGSIEKELSLSPTAPRKPLKIRYENLEQMDINIDSSIRSFDEENNTSAMVLPNKKNKNVSFAESTPIAIDTLTSVGGESASVKNIHIELQEIKEKLNQIITMLEKS